jgi:hypothetical protein
LSITNNEITQNSKSEPKNQGFGSGSGSGPDPHSNCGSGSRRAKMTHKIEKSTEFSCFEVLDDLF